MAVPAYQQPGNHAPEPEQAGDVSGPEDTHGALARFLDGEPVSSSEEVSASVLEALGATLAEEPAYHAVLFNRLRTQGHEAEVATAILSLAQRSADPAAKLYHVSELADLPEVEWVVPGWIELGGLHMLYGPSEAGKSFVAVDLVCSLAAGVQWLGKEVGPAPTLYVAAEGSRGCYSRVVAWCADREVDLAEPPAYMRLGPVDLTDGGEVDHLTRQIKEVGAALVVLDTLALCTPGVPENDNASMGQVVTSLKRISAKTGAAVLVVHHTGKDERKGSRGASALFAAMEGVLELEAGPPPTLRNRKQRNAESGEAVTARLDSVPGSLVVRWTPVSELDQELVSDILTTLGKEEGEGLSQKVIEERVGGNRRKVRTTLAVLANDPTSPVQERKGARNAKLYRLGREQGTPTWETK